MSGRVIQLLDRGCDDVRRQRFLAEGQLGLALSSPPADGDGDEARSAHLLATLGAGAWPDGRCVIALDRVEGIALSRAFVAVARDGGKIRAIAAAVLDALAHAHERG